MKNATATSHGKSRLLETDGGEGKEGAPMEFTGGISFEWRNDLTYESGRVLAWEVVKNRRIASSINLLKRDEL